MEPTAIDKILANKNIGDQRLLKSIKVNKKSLIITLKIITFGIAANNNVTQIGAPS